jgi:CAAX prenyl protease-like protein
LGRVSRDAAARVVPFGVFIAFLALDGPLSSAVLALELDPRWLYAVRSAIAAGLLGWFWKDYEELRSVAPRVSPRGWLIAVGVGAAVIVLWVALDAPPLAFTSGPGYDPRDPSGAINWGLALTRTAGSAIVVPVMEELFWRSFLMRWLERPAFLTVRPAAVGIKSIALGALLFGAEHTQWFAGILAGFAYSWLYVRTGNLWVPIAAHAASNALLAWWVLQTGAWHFW